MSIDGARSGAALPPVAGPHLRALVDDGIVFNGATTPTPQTFPATVSLLTGTYPSTHGVRDEFTAPLSKGVPTVAEAFREGGWVTGAYPGDPLSHSLSGIDRGFDHFARAAVGWGLSARADSALTFLDAHPGGNTFVWLGIGLAPHVGIWDRPMGTAFPNVAAYADRWAEVDLLLGRLRAAIDASPDGDRTVMVLVGTHGEVVPGWPGEVDALPGHGLDLAEDALWVPLLFYGPGQLSSRTVIGANVSTLDVAPTMLDLIGIDFDAAGVSLRPVFTGGEPPDRVLFHETTTTRLTGWGSSVAARSGGRKLVRHPDREVLLQVASNVGEPIDGLREAIEARYGPAEGEAHRPQAILEIRNIWDRARAGDAPSAGAALDSLAVAEPANALVQIQRAFFRMVMRDERVAARIFLDLLTERPEVVEAESAYLEHLLHYAEYRVAIDRLEARYPQPMYELERRWALAGLYLVNAELQSAKEAFASAAEVGSPPGARWRRFRELAPRLEDSFIGLSLDDQDYAAHLKLGIALGELEIYEDAYRHIQAARGLEPKDPEPEYWLGHFLLQEGRTNHSRVAFKRAIEKDPDYQPALIAMSYLQVGAAELEAALANLARAVEISGAPPEAHYNYACLLARAERRDEALAQLEVSLKKGYANLDLVRTDADLVSLRDDPRFAELLERYLP